MHTCDFDESGRCRHCGLLDPDAFSQEAMKRETPEYWKEINRQMTAPRPKNGHE